jgi:small-conductance mechanosensitive channel
MSEHKVDTTLIAEILLVLLATAFYFGLRMYPSATPFSEYPVSQVIAFQVAVAVSGIFIISLLMDLYGVITKNVREMHDLIHVFRLIAYPLLILVLLNTLGISIAGLLVGAGFLGIIVGLAAQTALGNVFSGISMLYANPFKAGDKITFTPMSFGIQAPSHPHETMFSEITGTVKSIGIIYTRLMKDDWSMMYIPNSALNQGLIQNQSRVSERLIRIRLGVSRDTDFDLFKKKLVALLSKNKTEYEKLMGLDVRVSLVSTEQDLGISVTARAKVLDYDELSRWLSEKSINALNEVEKEKTKKDSKGKNKN